MSVCMNAYEWGVVRVCRIMFDEREGYRDLHRGAVCVRERGRFVMCAGSFPLDG